MRNCVIPTLLGLRVESERVLCADYGLGVRGIVVRILKVAKSCSLTTGSRRVLENTHLPI